MKEVMKYALAITASAVAMFAYMYEAPPERVVQAVAYPAISNTTITAQAAIPQQPATQTKPQERELTAAELANIDPASIDWEAMRRRYDGLSDPMIFRWTHLDGFTEREIAAFNKLHVVPFNPMIDQTCERSLSGIQGVGDADGVWEVCSPIHLHNEHPYASLTLEELKPLAKSDPYAAEFAIRLAEDFQSRMNFALHAVAMSGKPGPILEGLYRSDLVSLAEGRDPNLILEELAVEMAFQKVAQRLGDPRATTQNLRQILDKHIVSPSERENFLEGVQFNADELVRTLAQAQRDITGQTTIGEANDA